VLAFGTLVAATVAAFFVTQHLKVTTPLIAGNPRPDPSWINPLDGVTCGSAGDRVDHRVMRISFYLLHRSDNVDVYVVDQSGAIVATLASARYMRGGAHPVRSLFTWDGRQDDGRIAPDGVYYIRVALRQQGRTVDIANAAGQAETVTVRTAPPHPVITAVSPPAYPQRGRVGVTIRYAGNENRGGTVQLYRTGLAGGPKFIKSFPTPWKGQSVDWNATVRGERPAPQGTYLIGLDVTDAACNTGRFPATMPPPPGTTPHAGVTVQYLAAEPRLDPVAAGSRALLTVDSVHQPYTWSLLRVGATAPTGSGSGQTPHLRVHVPAAGAGLYVLSLRSGVHTTHVPIVASGAGGRPSGASRYSRSSAKLLVVLPALTWQGLNPRDDDGDGLPDTLADGRRIPLLRPFIDGLPAGFSDEAGLLAYLDKAHLAYDLTTDLALLDGNGPRPTSYRGIVLAGSERWLPGSLRSQLRSYVQHGGHVLSLGIDSLHGSVTVELAVARSLVGATALDPMQPSDRDVFGARAGPLVSHNHAPIVERSDGLGIFSGTSGSWPGYADYQPISSVRGATIASAAGTIAGAPAIAGFRLGRGLVVEVGLGNFGSSIARSRDAQQLINRLWTVLAKSPK